MKLTPIMLGILWAGFAVGGAGGAIRMERMEARIEIMEGAAPVIVPESAALTGGDDPAPSFTDSLRSVMGEPDAVVGNTWWYGPNGFVIENDRCVGFEKRGE